MLVIEPFKRITASEALKHSFFQAVVSLNPFVVIWLDSVCYLSIAGAETLRRKKNVSIGDNDCQSYGSYYTVKTYTGTAELRSG